MFYDGVRPLFVPPQSRLNKPELWSICRGYGRLVKCRNHQLVLPSKYENQTSPNTCEVLCTKLKPVEPQSVSQASQECFRMFETGLWRLASRFGKFGLLDIRTGSYTTSADCYSGPVIFPWCKHMLTGYRVMMLNHPTLTLPI